MLSVRRAHKQEGHKCAKACDRLRADKKQECALAQAVLPCIKIRPPDKEGLKTPSERGGRTHDRADMSRLLCQLSYLATWRDRRWPVATAHVLYRARAPFVKGKHTADQP